MNNTQLKRLAVEFYTRDSLACGQCEKTAGYVPVWARTGYPGDFRVEVRLCREHAESLATCGKTGY